MPCCAVAVGGNTSTPNVMNDLTAQISYVCLTQRGKGHFKVGNMIVYSDGVSNKLWQSQRDMLHTFCYKNLRM